MATTGTQGLQRASISSQRAQQTIAATEAYFGGAIGGHTGNNSTSQETSSWKQLEFDFTGSVDKTDRQ
tara:strand:- start:696 stop:899 length:204 start_codon:yes stop_codon:yes gene_type:complete